MTAPSLVVTSPTQFAWQCIGAPEWLPPEPKRGDRYGPDERCWLCGGPTDGVGWPREHALPDTFTNHNLARVQLSQTLCQACVYLGSKAGWDHYRSQQPDDGLKSGHAVSWRNYSHLFVPGHHECPSRARLRELLLDPPEPPFLLVVAVSGQKHLLFRARVALSRAQFPVQFEDESIVVDHDRFTAVLRLVEQLLALGFTRAEIASGRYDVNRIHRAGLAAWRAVESVFSAHRLHHPDLVRLAVHVARDPRKEGP